MSVNLFGIFVLVESLELETNIGGGGFIRVGIIVLWKANLERTSLDFSPQINPSY